jgi:predicted Zn finger-like uncharacterized protein
MEFSCEKCRTRYSVPDEKVRGKRVRTRCRKCGADVVINGPGAPGPSLVPKLPRGSADPPAEVAPHGDHLWTVALSRTEQKKMTTAEIVDAYASGVVSDHTLVWKQGMANWSPPFGIPGIAIALTARGLVQNAGWREPGRVSLPPPPAPPHPSDALASDWDDDNEATRVSEGALPFIARMMMPSAPPMPRPAPLPSPTASRSPVPSPNVAVPRSPVPKVPPVSAAPAAPSNPVKPVLPRPSVPRPPAAPRTAPVRAVSSAPLPVPNAAPSARPVPAPTSPIRSVGAAPPSREAEAQAHTVDTKPPPPPSSPLASDPSAFSFDDEATEVIAPDRARALLEAETAKSEENKEHEESETPSETPMAFGFEDESTQVIAPDRAEELLHAEAARSSSIPGEGSPRTPAFPDPEVASGATARRADAGDAVRQKTEPMPSIVVAKAKEPEPEVPKAASPPAKGPSAVEPRDIIRAFQNEPTRVVRVVKKKSGTRQLWIVIGLALVAAAAGGFIASEILARQHRASPAPAPARPRVP